jgi:hypothetical protein
VNETFAAIAFWAAPVIFALLCAALSTGSPAPHRVRLVVAGVGSQLAGVVVSWSCLLAMAWLRLPAPSEGLSLAVIFFPGATAAATLFIMAHRAAVGFPRGTKPLVAGTLMCLAASLALAVSAEFAEGRPWILDNRLDYFPEFSGPYLLVWFVSLPIILRAPHSRLSLAA